MLLQYSIFFSLLILVTSRKHTLDVHNDSRYIIRCSLFGYESGSYLVLNATDIVVTNNQFLFVLDKTQTSGLSNYRESKLAGCVDSGITDAANMAFLKLSQDNFIIKNHGKGLLGLEYVPLLEEVSDTLSDDLKLKRILNSFLRYFIPKGVEFDSVIKKIVDYLMNDSSTKRELTNFFTSPNEWTYIRQVWYIVDEHFASEAPKLDVKTSNTTPPVLDVANVIDTVRDYFGSDFKSLVKIPVYHRQYDKIEFVVKVLFPSVHERGLYGLYIHNCPKPISNKMTVYPLSLTVSMIEKNPGTFLSSGEAKLPSLYTAFSIVYYVLSVSWLFYLRLSKNIIFKLHYLMFGVLITKAISLTFHGINFYMIGQYGTHEKGWAIMYYIAHMVRGALFFVTIVLIGAGWAFVKHMLTNRERTVFMVIVPLQILANIAAIVIGESEEGTLRYSMWREILIFVDLACCAAILLPVVWSIRHLKSASQIDGKAASSLSKLRLFRHFYIMIISYIYLTRIIVYLLSITVPFQLNWLVEALKEAITLAFVIAVGVKFRPVENNPYLLVAMEEDEEDTVVERIQMEQVWSQSGVNEGVTKKLSTKIIEDGNSDEDDFPNSTSEKAKLIDTKYE